jgi:CRP-like cAMP-binding protein
MSKPKQSMRTKATPSDPTVLKLLQSVSVDKTPFFVRRGRRIFTQGEAADDIYFLEKGRVKIAVVSESGKEAVLAMLGPPSFLGEGCLVGQSRRVGTATALEPCTLYKIDRESMLQTLRQQPKFSERFVACLLARNIDLEEDLCDQLFNHSEKRLARVLLKLARLQEHDRLSDAKVPVLSHETLAEMVGTTRSRITHFMNKFRKLGLIEYNGELMVRTELLTDVVLHD